MFAQLTVTGYLRMEDMERNEINCMNDCGGRSHGMFHRCPDADCAEYVECING